VFPDWRPHMRVESGADGSSYFVVEVNPPAVAAVHRGLSIHTDNEEVTVGFDYYHSHFESMLGDGEAGEAGAVELVQRIIDERIVVVSWWLDDQWKGSQQVEAGARPSAEFVTQYTLIRIRSWNGTFNADVRA
jgi:hypothetical protein